MPVNSAAKNDIQIGEHVIESAVEVWQEYQQRYDPEREELLIGPTSIADKYDAYGQYDCSCGESFTDQTAAVRHLIEETRSPP